MLIAANVSGETCNQCCLLFVLALFPGGLSVVQTLRRRRRHRHDSLNAWRQSKAGACHRQE